MSTWEKAFDTFQWENRSQSTNTPLDATHLNKVNDALDVIDDRVIELQSADADIEEEIAGKQDVLTFDDVPTDESNNPVKSNGIYDALNGKVDKNGTDRLMTADEGTKLAGIAAGAQVNVLEGVVVDSIVQPISGKKAFIDLSGKTNLSVIAIQFRNPVEGEPQMAFYKGAYVTYNGKLYELTEEHTGAWNPSHAREIKTAGQYVRAGNGGYNTGDRATCEGYDVKASGNYSHAEGRETQAVGECAHAEGRETIANGIYQHVEGKYNIADNENKYIHIIGNGIDDNNRSNAMTLDWEGNLEVSGEVEDGNGEKISDKADRPESAVAGHLAGLDSNGNLTDSGVSPTEDVTIEGNPITFDSPFEQDAKSVVVSVKPIQDLHGYDHPWVGGASANKWDETTKNGYWLHENGQFAPDPNQLCSNDYIEVAPSEEYYFCFSTTGWSILFYDENKTYLSYENANKSFVTPNNCKYITFNCGAQYGNTYHHDIAINYPATITTYSPYSNICPISGIDEVEIEVSDGESEPTTTTIPLPSTLYDADVDVTEGSADSKWKKVTFNSKTGVYLFQQYDGTNFKHALFRFDVSDMRIEASPNLENIKSNWAEVKYVNDNSVYNMFTCRKRSNQAQILLFTPTDWGEVTLDELGDFLAQNPIEFCYELATPTTISLTPTDVELLEGTNVVSTNAEKVAVTYGRSLWQDIDKLKTDTEGKLDKSDVATIEGDTASKAYSVNDFMLRADGFYKVTQPIASGASITASNTTKTTIGAVLTALLNA